MEKEDFDILIGMIEELDVFNSFYDCDFEATNERRNLLNKIGVKYKLECGYGFYSVKIKIEYGEIEKIENWLKQNGTKLSEYLETMDKPKVGRLAVTFGKAFDDEILKKILSTEIEEYYDEYNLNNNDIAKILLYVKDSEFKKKMLDYVVEQYEGDPEDIHFEEYEIEDILISINDIDYIKKYIDEGYYSYGYDSNKMYFSGNSLTRLLKFTNDVDYIKEVLDRGTYYFRSTDVAELLEFMNDSEYTNKVRGNSEKYGLKYTESEELSLLEYINKLDDLEEELDFERLQASKNIVIKLVRSVNKPEFTKKVIRNWRQINFEDYEIVFLLEGLKDIKEIVKNRQEYDLSGELIARGIEHRSDKDEVLKLVDKETSEIYRSNYAPIEYIKEHLSVFLTVEGANIEQDVVLQMAERNEDIFKVDFNILESKYINLLGKDKINQIASYPYIVDRVLKLNDGELNLFGKALDGYIEETKGEEWTPLANRILENIDNYGELISNLEGNEDIDLSKLIPILIHQNDFDIKTIEDVEKFKEIKRSKCEELIKGKTIEEKQKGVLLKIFEQGIDETQELISKFGEDIDKIEDKDLKAYIKSLKEILTIDNPKTLEEIFDNVEELETNNPILMERMLKTEYWKLYNNDLFKVEDAKKLPDGENIYSAGIDFKMIITSVGAYSFNQPEDYNKDWNRVSLGSQHFCASYIRNDMLGHAPVPHICYGFEEMKEDSLMLSGSGDIYSSGVSFESIANRGEKYLAPDSQIGNTYRYNEMDFRRIQGGEKKQPDYIVVFRKNGEIDNMDKAQKASKDFDGLPIVVIDVDECLASEKQKAEELFEEYKETGNPDVRKQLEEKLRNNRVTDDSFCRDTNMDVVLESLDEKEETIEKETEPEVSMKDLDEIYGEVSGKERQEEAGKIRTIYEKIKNIKEREDDSDAR